MVIAVLITRMDSDVIGDISHYIHAGAWGYALVLMILQILGLTLRWHYLINLTDNKTSYMTSLRITLAGLLANFLFITSISGIFVRIALIIQQGISMTRAICATITDRLMTLAALIILSALCLPALAYYIDSNTYTILASAISLLAFFGFIFIPLFFNNILKNIVYPGRKLKRFAPTFKYIRTFLSSKEIVGKTLAISLISQLFYFFAIYLIAVSTGAEVSFLTMLYVLPIITLVASLPISLGGWGVREGAFIYGLGLIGVPMETAFIISIQIGILSILSTVIASLPTLLGKEELNALKKAPAVIKAPPQSRY